MDENSETGSHRLRELQRLMSGALVVEVVDRQAPEYEAHDLVFPTKEQAQQVRVLLSSLGVRESYEQDYGPEQGEYAGFNVYAIGYQDPQTRAFIKKNLLPHAWGSVVLDGNFSPEEYEEKYVKPATEKINALLAAAKKAREFCIPGYN